MEKSFFFSLWHEAQIFWGLNVNKYNGFFSVDKWEFEDFKTCLELLKLQIFQILKEEKSLVMKNQSIIHWSFLISHVSYSAESIKKKNTHNYNSRILFEFQIVHRDWLEQMSCCQESVGVGSKNWKSRIKIAKFLDESSNLFILCKYELSFANSAS